MNDQAPHSVAQPSFSGGSFLPLISGGHSVTYSHYSELVTMCEGGSNKFQKLVHCVKFK